MNPHLSDDYLSVSLSSGQFVCVSMTVCIFIILLLYKESRGLAWKKKWFSFHSSCQRSWNCSCNSLHWGWLEAGNCILHVCGCDEGERILKISLWTLVNPESLGATMRLCRLRVCLVYQTKVCEYESDLGSNEHYLSSSENKAWKKFRPLWYGCTGIAKVLGSSPVQAWIFVGPHFRYRSNSVHYCKDRFRIQFLIRSSHISIFIYSQSFRPKYVT